ncbi:asparagine synthase (glutamine-hydrolyzing) [Urechidicola croceus]|uniref:asparagine synthase (glutamine-hydrolyzing) n=1 Tax=Urechidicola croceus TaxID=1850246 RepID=A0A1D8PB50_9FLAO|nr:asparagine synthase (glutamine-hydrolyzing) [Urechidicola croceus]AOW21777.1 asparagine synthase (glutamine-hydrolyzing) [Urechidicola croceus]
MCGIAGIININTTSPISSHLVSMTKSMINRGPDDEGYLLFNDTSIPYSGDDTLYKNCDHINSTFSKSSKLGFGFRQLKIIDLSNNSHQPMCDLDRKYWIVFNGEIYNFKEIRSELQSLGYTFFSDSDTEVVLNAYKKWGDKCLDKFNGMFAFAIFDKVKNEVFFARDRVGIKPLYYHINQDQILFGSTIKSIIDSKLYTPKINWKGLWQNFRFSIAQRPETCLENIVALEPAHYLKFNFDSKTFIKKQYWEIPINTQNFSLTEKQSVNLIEESLYNSIKYRLNADVEVGSFMSGGIDSTTISVIASKLNPNIKTMTLGFNDFEDYNEVEQAIETAKLHNLNHKITYIHPTEIIQNINETTVAYEEPYHHLSANFILARIAKENNIKVVLNGLGGDELFGGYDVYKKLNLWENLKKNKKLIKSIPKIHPKINKAHQLSNYKTIDEYYSHYYTTYKDSSLKKLFTDHNYSTKNLISNNFNPKNLQFTDNFEAISFYNLKSYIGSHQMRTLDQFTMNFSIEGRLPLLDHKFIETAFKIPTKYKLKNNSQKYIFKEVAKKYISPSCLSMSKKGLRLPLEHWIKSDLYDLVYDNINQLKNRNIFNNSEVDKIVKGKDEMKIWQLVSTELWLNNYIKQK